MGNKITGQPFLGSRSFIISVCFFRSPFDILIEYCIIMSATKSLSLLVLVVEGVAEGVAGVAGVGFVWVV